MTSVPNHLPLLNGNKVFIAVLICLTALLLPACNSIKKIKSKPSPPRSEGERTVPSEKDRPMKVDTMIWTRDDKAELPTAPNQPEVKESDIIPGKKDLYKVGVLIPLYSASGESVSQNENLRRMLHFVLGMELAAARKGKGTPEVIFEIIDVEHYSNRIQSLVNKDSLGKYDIIIGPYKTSDLQAVSRFSDRYKIPLISPWNASSTITDNNPKYVQIKPGLKMHAEKISDHIAKTYPQADVCLIAKSGHTREIESMDFFYNSPAFKSRSYNLRNLQKSIIVEDDQGFDEEIRSLLRGDSRKIFILPYYTNWDFVSKFLNRLNRLKREDQNVMVYGLPQLVESGKIDFKYFDELNIHISYFNYTDPSDPEVARFNRQFVESYGDRPLEDAYLGYDLATWISYSLKQYGPDFIQKSAYADYRQGLFNNIELMPVYGGNAPKDDFSNFIYSENKSLKIVKYSNSKFQPVE